MSLSIAVWACAWILWADQIGPGGYPLFPVMAYQTAQECQADAAVRLRRVEADWVAEGYTITDRGLQVLVARAPGKSRLASATCFPDSKDPRQRRRE